MFDNTDGKVHRNRGGEGLDITGGHDLPWFQLYFLDVLYEMLGVFEMVWGLANQRTNNVGQLLVTPYVMDALLEEMGLRGVPTLCILGRP